MENTKKTAAQRINQLEGTLVKTLQLVGQLEGELGMAKEALGLLGSKLDAVVELTNSGKALSPENISVIMIGHKAAKLAEGTQNLINNGILVVTNQVAEDSFIVGREVEEDGTVTNPRIQFTAEATQPHLKEKLLGKKVLDRIVVEEGKAQLELLEIYQITQPQQAPAAAPQAQA